MQVFHVICNGLRFSVPILRNSVEVIIGNYPLVLRWVWPIHVVPLENFQPWAIYANNLQWLVRDFIAETDIELSKQFAGNCNLPQRHVGHIWAAFNWEDLKVRSSEKRSQSHENYKHIKVDVFYFDENRQTAMMNTLNSIMQHIRS